MNGDVSGDFQQQPIGTALIAESATSSAGEKRAALSLPTTQNANGRRRSYFALQSLAFPALSELKHGAPRVFCVFYHQTNPPLGLNQ